MKLYHKAFLFRHKWIQPYLQKVLGGIDAVTFLAALALIGGVVYEHGFIISEGAEADLGVLYRTVWGVFLVQTTMHIGLAYRETLKKYRTFTWVLNILLYLTLIPVIFFEPESGALKYFWLFLNNRIFQLILLLLLSLLRLSSGVIGLLGKRTNPSLILAGSFFLIICIGTGLLMLPRCTVDKYFVCVHQCCLCDRFGTGRCSDDFHFFGTVGHYYIDTDRWVGSNDAHLFLRHVFYG